MSKPHKERAHSKFSASGAERWMSCPGSVELSEGMPDKPNVYSIEGTHAHEVLETLMRIGIESGVRYMGHRRFQDAPPEMVGHGLRAASFILGLHEKTPDADVSVESRVHLDFIHPEMFGTYDGAVIEHFGTLHVFDYKYGQGHAVSPKGNLQMIFYALGLAHKFDWNFKTARLWIIQPRVRNYVGPLYWDIPIEDLMRYVTHFKLAVDRVLAQPKAYREGEHCYWCKAKSVCPLKQDKKLEAIQNIFKKGGLDGKEKSDKESDEKDFF